jgi:hypothetical protein
MYCNKEYIVRKSVLSDSLKKLFELLPSRNAESVTLISVKPLDQNTIYDYYLTTRKN